MASCKECTHFKDPPLLPLLYSTLFLDFFFFFLPSYDSSFATNYSSSIGEPPRFYFVSVFTPNKPSTRSLFTIILFGISSHSLHFLHCSQFEFWFHSVTGVRLVYTFFFAPDYACVVSVLDNFLIF